MYAVYKNDVFAGQGLLGGLGGGLGGAGLFGQQTSAQGAMGAGNRTGLGGGTGILGGASPGTGLFGQG